MCVACGGRASFGGVRARVWRELCEWAVLMAMMCVRGAWVRAPAPHRSRAPHDCAPAAAIAPSRPRKPTPARGRCRRCRRFTSSARGGRGTLEGGAGRSRLDGREERVALVCSGAVFRFGSEAVCAACPWNHVAEAVCAACPWNHVRLHAASHDYRSPRAQPALLSPPLPPAPPPIRLCIPPSPPPPPLNPTAKQLPPPPQAQP